MLTRRRPDKPTGASVNDTDDQDRFALTHWPENEVSWICYDSELGLPRWHRSPEDAERCAEGIFDRELRLAKAVHAS